MVGDAAAVAAVQPDYEGVITFIDVITHDYASRAVLFL